MANISNSGSFYPYKTDKNELYLVKCNKEHKCSNCYNKIPSKSYCVGANYRYGFKICLSCADKFLNNFIKSVEDFKQIGVKTLKDIKKNRKKYEQVNTMARI